MSKELYQSLARKTAEQFGIPVPMFMALVDHESRWNPAAVSKAGAVGLGQVMPANLKSRGIDIEAYKKDPALQLNQAAFWYQDAIRQAKGDPVLGLAYYNASPKAVNRFLEGKAQLPRETADYVPTVLWGAQKFGGAPLPNAAFEDVKARFGSRVSPKTVVAKTGQAPMPAAQYAKPDGAGLDAPSQFDLQAAQQMTAQATPAQVTPPQPQQMAAPQFTAPELAQSPDLQLANTTAQLQQVVPQEFDLTTALGITPEQERHGYPDWFGKMVSSEVETA